MYIVLTVTAWWLTSRFLCLLAAPSVCNAPRTPRQQCHWSTGPELIPVALANQRSHMTACPPFSPAAGSTNCQQPAASTKGLPTYLLRSVLRTYGVDMHRINVYHSLTAKSQLFLFSFSPFSDALLWDFGITAHGLAFDTVHVGTWNLAPIVDRA